jgi:hypothetical protein
VGAGKYGGGVGWVKHANGFTASRINRHSMKERETGRKISSKASLDSGEVILTDPSLPLQRDRGRMAP